MLSVNLPFCGSKTCSTLPDSTPYIDILPSCDPDITNLSHGENATVHRSTGPRASCFSRRPELELQKQSPESKELLAIVLPSRLIATETTPREWPGSCWRSLSCCSLTSQILTWLSRPPVTIKSFSVALAFGDLAFHSSVSNKSSSLSLFSETEGLPHAHDHILSAWAVSCLWSSENWGHYSYGKF